MPGKKQITRGKTWSLVCAAGLSLLQAPGAWAQDEDTSEETDASGMAVPQALPQPEAPASSTVQPFADDGITLALTYTGEAAGNVTGGLRRDAAYAGQLLVGADLDMNRIAGLPGGQIHAIVVNRHGKSLSEIAIGNNTSLQETYGMQNTHLAVLTWEQKLFNGRVTIEAGRSVSNIQFLFSPIYCNFQGNSFCGNPVFAFKNSNFTGFPASSWMARARVQVTGEFFAHAGVYEVNPDRKTIKDHGFDFDTRHATGVYVPWELGYEPGGADARLPGRYILGGWFDEGDYDDPLLDNQGGIAVLTGGDPLQRKGRSALFFRFEQQLTRPDPASRRGLAMFGVAMANVSGRVEESRFFSLGLVQTGTFAGRGEDTLGFAVSDQRFSGLAMERMRAARLAAGGDGHVQRHQYMMELNYGAQIRPGVRFSPNLQYIVNPDQTGAPFQPADSGNAFIFGFKFTVDAFGLLGG